ncbi:MAG: phosphatase PAP2 family protein [Bacteroidia bacterium]
MKKLTLIILGVVLSVTVFAQNWDIDLLKTINLNRNTQLDAAFIGITNSVAPIAFGVPILFFGMGLIKRDSIYKANGLYIGSSILTSIIISNILKYSVNKPRPFETYNLIQKITDGGSPSFPSGHTSDAFALAIAVSIIYPKWYVIAPSFLWAGAVGYSRMDLGVHYPSDVLAGAIVGSGSALLTYELNKWINKKRVHHHNEK